MTPPNHSPEIGRCVCAVVGLPRESISDAAVVLALVLLLTRKPRATAFERAHGGLYHDDLHARCHDEPARKIGPAREGAQAGPKTMKAADAELERLKLITRYRVESEHGRKDGQHTSYHRDFHPEAGRHHEL